MQSMKYLAVIIGCISCIIINGCANGGQVLNNPSASEIGIDSLKVAELTQLAEIKQKQSLTDENSGLKKLIQDADSYSAERYLAQFAKLNTHRMKDYIVDGYDVIDIIVYEEDDLSRKNVRVSADGMITFPLIGRLQVAGTTPSDIEHLITRELEKGQFLLNAHVSVTVTEYKSKQFMVLGSVKKPGTFPLKAKETVLDAISKAGGIDFEQSGKQGVIVRTLFPDTPEQKKIAIHIDFETLLKGQNQSANLILMNNDMLYVSQAEHFYIIGQVKNPGSYPLAKQLMTIVEAISIAGGFTQIASRNHTRIIRMEQGVEKVIEIRVDEITQAGRKNQDIQIYAGDIIVVPESFF
jgi:polysaccharide export outer membrane protein